jgi:sugar lactone lactonase YvrE
MKRITKLGLWAIAIISGIVITIGIGGCLYVKTSSPHLLRFSTGVMEKVIETSLEELPEAIFMKGMTGCENLYLDDASQSVYVTDLQGHVHWLNGETWDTLKIVKSKKIGEFVLGIAKGPDKRLYLNVCEKGIEGWKEEGGAVWRIDLDLTGPEKLTRYYQCINGLAIDRSGNLYFASANASIMHPEGNVYRMTIGITDSYAKPELFLSDVGWANGLYFNPGENRFYFSNTVEGCFTFSPGIPKLEAIYYKTKILETLDDLCTDTKGRLWMTDPGKSTVKVFDPKTRQLNRYKIKGIGQTSSCRIRLEHGEAILYITELKRTQDPLSQVLDGRGLLIMPLRSLAI